MSRIRWMPLFAGIAGSILTVAAFDWPIFLGPHHNGTSLETGLLDAWPASGPRVLWDREVGTGYGAPSVLDGRLVLHHRLGDEEIVESMNARDGTLIWRFGYPSSFVDPFGYNNGPRCTPLLTTNRCYTFGAEGKLLCLDSWTGTVVWERDTAREWEVPESFFGVGSTPLLDDNKLFVMIGGMPDSGVVALDPGTGRTLWESVGQRTWEGRPKTGWPGEPPVTWGSEHHQASYASPIMATIHGRRHLLCLMRQGLVSLDPADGKVNFTFWFRAPINESVNAMTPVVTDDLILISSAYYRSGSVLLRVGPDGNSVEPLRRDRSLEIHWSTPILHEGYLYAFSGRNEPDARFRCVNMLSGEVAWDRDESWRRYGSRQPDAYGRGSAIAADGKLIVLGEGGLLGLFLIDPARPEELARWQVPQLAYPCWAAPVLASKRLYLRSESQLVCLDLAEPGAGDD